MTDKFNSWMTTRKMICLLAIFATVWFLFTAILTVLRYRANLTSTYDFGIFSQMYYYMDKVLKPLTTCERDGLLSHFAVHMSPIFYSLLPAFHIFPSPETLLILQAFIVISGVIPFSLLCRFKGLSNTETLGFCLLYCLFPALLGGSFYDFHENAFLPVIILWVLYLMETKHYKAMLAASMLILLVKEDAPVYAACIGLYLLTGKKKYKTGIILFTLSCVYFCIVVWFINQYGDGAMINRYDNYISDKSLGLISMFKTILVNPAYLLIQIAVKEKLIFFLQMILPFGFLPFLTKRWARWIFLIPLVLINLMPDYSYQHSIFHQYTFGPSALLFYLTLMNYQELRGRARKWILPVSLAFSTGLFLYASSSKGYILETYQANREEIALADELMATIPDYASVKASTFFVPKLSMRDQVYTGTSKYDADYIVLDMREGMDIYAEESYSRYITKGYHVLGEVEDYVIVLTNH